MTEQQQPSEEELRAAYEAEIKKIRVEHILLEHVVSMVNMGMRRTGTAPGTEDERDPEQVRIAIEAIKGVLPLLEQTAPQQIVPIRQALSQLQLAYVRIGGQAPGEGGGEGQAAPERGAEQASADPATGQSSTEQSPTGQPSPGQPSPGQEEQGPGPAQRSGRLWVPGQ